MNSDSSDSSSSSDEENDFIYNNNYDMQNLNYSSNYKNNTNKFIKKKEILTIDSIKRSDGHFCNSQVSMVGEGNSREFTGVNKVYNNIVSFKLLKITIPKLITNQNDYNFYDNTNTFFLELDTFYPNIVSNNNNYSKDFCQLIPSNRNIPEKNDLVPFNYNLGYIDLIPIGNELIFDTPISTINSLSIKLTDDNEQVIYNNLTDSIAIKYLDWNDDKTLKICMNKYLSNNNLLINDKITLSTDRKKIDSSNILNMRLLELITNNAYILTIKKLYLDISLTKGINMETAEQNYSTIDVQFKTVMINYVANIYNIEKTYKDGTAITTNSSLTNQISVELINNINYTNGTQEYYASSNANEKLFKEMEYKIVSNNFQITNTSGTAVDLPVDNFKYIFLILKMCCYNSDGDYELLYNIYDDEYSTYFFRLNITDDIQSGIDLDINSNSNFEYKTNGEVRYIIIKKNTIFNQNIYTIIQNIQNTVKGKYGTNDYIIKKNVIIKNSVIYTNYNASITNGNTIIGNGIPNNTTVVSVKDDQIFISQNTNLSNNTNNTFVDVIFTNYENKYPIINKDNITSDASITDISEYVFGTSNNTISHLKVLTLLVNKYIVELLCINLSKRVVYTFEIGHLLPDSSEISKLNYS